jgi:hypothetical protein
MKLTRSSIVTNNISKDDNNNKKKKKREKKKEHVGKSFVANCEGSYTNTERGLALYIFGRMRVVTLHISL